MNAVVSIGKVFAAAAALCLVTFEDLVVRFRRRRAWHDSTESS